MAEQTKQINTSIDEYLISLANSINHAQRYISQLRVVGQEGQPTVTYQLPRVDFELKLLFQLTATRPETAGLQRDMARSVGGAYLAATPISLETGEVDSATAAAASTIKGSFVAVPIHGGAPPPIVSIAWTRSDKAIDIKVSVRSAIGQNLPNVEVEFNLDRSLAKRVNPALGTETEEANVLAETSLSAVIARTDPRGEATSTLMIGEKALGRKVPVVIDVMGITKTMIFETTGNP
ncbi:hypothetical protein [Methyloterricola oryzae]|uniref:hypothetical protein n=1 Tax=Methyloterricola oryzae TaxID=1495050 RepID=UPI0005EB436E|nr:hypothetical protein [Methyloterricola oryzae]